MFAEARPLLARRMLSTTLSAISASRVNRLARSTIATQAAIAERASAHWDQISDKAETSWSMSASEWNGEGVMRSRSVPLGTVG